VVVNNQPDEWRGRGGNHSSDRKGWAVLCCALPPSLHFNHMLWPEEIRLIVRP